MNLNNNRMATLNEESSELDEDQTFEQFMQKKRMQMSTANNNQDKKPRPQRNNKEVEVITNSHYSLPSIKKAPVAPWQEDVVSNT